MKKILLICSFALAFAACGTPEPGTTGTTDTTNPGTTTTDTSGTRTDTSTTRTDTTTRP